MLEFIHSEWTNGEASELALSHKPPHLSLCDSQVGVGVGIQHSFSHLDSQLAGTWVTGPYWILL